MNRPGPDISCSMDPLALSDLVEGSRVLFECRGGKKGPVDAEKSTIDFAFASVVAIKDIKAGENLNEENIWVKRPRGGDFNASDFEKLLGKKAKLTVNAGSQLKRSQILID